MKADLIPVTQLDRGSAEAPRRLGHQGHRAAQLALQVQPMSYLPRDRAPGRLVCRFGSAFLVLAVETFVQRLSRDTQEHRQDASGGSVIASDGVPAIASMKLWSAKVVP